MCKLQLGSVLQARPTGIPSNITTITPAIMPAAGALGQDSSTASAALAAATAAVTAGA
jgi:hypothetical protein